MKTDSTLWRFCNLFVVFFTHFLLFASTYWVVTLAVSSTDTNLVRIHVITSTIAWGLLLLEGVFSISGDVLLRKCFTRPQRVNVHFGLQIVGLLFFIISMAAIKANKQPQGPNHSPTDHAKLGGVSFVGIIAISIGGLMLMGGDKVLPRSRIWHFKCLHSCLGQLSTMCGLAALITGIYKDWLPTDDLTRHILAGSIGFGGFLTLVKPFFELLGRIRSRYSSRKLS